MQYGKTLLAAGLILSLTTLNAEATLTKVDKVLAGSFVLLLREVLVDVARMDRSFDASKLPAILAIMHGLGVSDNSLTTPNSDAMPSGTLSRKLLIAYLKAVAGNLNDQQRNIVLTGIAAVISAEGKVGGNKKNVFRQYIIALGFPENQAEKIMAMVLNA